MVDQTVATLVERGYATMPDAIGAEQVAWARTDLERILADTPSGRDDFEGRRTRRFVSPVRSGRARPAPRMPSEARPVSCLCPARGRGRARTN